MDPSTFRFILRTHLFPINFQFEGRLSKSYTWFFRIDSNSFSIFVLHSSLVGQVRVSWIDLGLASSYWVTIWNSSSISNRCRGIIYRERFLNINSFTVFAMSTSSLPLNSSITCCLGMDLMSGSIIS